MSTKLHFNPIYDPSKKSIFHFRTVQDMEKFTFTGNSMPVLFDTQCFSGMRSVAKKSCNWAFTALLVVISTLFLTSGNESYGQCQSGTPGATVVFTGLPAGSYTSPVITRNKTCCSLSNVKCVKFDVTLDADAMGLIFNIASGSLPGTTTYQAGCGTNITLGSPACLSGTGPFSITFCASTAGTNSYSIVSLPRPKVQQVVYGSTDCGAKIKIAGLTRSSITWTDITGGGTYNSFLNCTSGCDSITVSTGTGFPAYVDYKVSGNVTYSSCFGASTFSDTVRVYKTTNLSVSVTPSSATACSSPGALLTGSFTGGASPFHYYWTNGSNGTGSVVANNSYTYTATTSGTYSFVVEDSRYPGCSAKYANASVTITAGPSLSVLPFDPQVCAGTPVTLTASGANSYSWAPATGLSATSGATVTASNLVNTTYTITGTSNGCTATTTINYISITPPIVEAGSPDTICKGSSITLHGSGGTIYSWSPTTGLSSPSVANPVATPLVTTTYVLHGWSPSGQVINNGNFSAGNTGFWSSYIYQSNLIPEGDYYIGTNPNTYHSNFSPCTDHTTGTGNMMIINGAPTANVTVWCQTIATIPGVDYAFSTWVTSVHPTSPAVLQFSINGVLLGSPFTAPATTCQWTQFYALWNAGSNTTATICIVNQNTALTGNDFALDDINFSPYCDAVDSVKITVSNPTITISSTNVKCAGGNNGSASASASGGIPGYSYHWSNGSSSSAISNLIAGTYTVTATDANSCTATASVTITQPAPLSGTISSSNVKCNGGNSGSASISATGGTSPYNYNWSNGTTAAANTNLVIGTYTVTITDANSCTATASITITQPSALSVTTSSTNVKCNGGNSGSASVSASGGTSPYTYTWSNGTTTAANNNLVAGTYSVTVTDANSCTATASVTVTQPTVLTASTTITNGNCNGGNTGSASASAAGGTPAYSYHWSNGLNVSTFSNLPAGSYSVTVTDANSCTATASVTISQPTAITTTTTSTNVKCNGGNSGSASVAATGGTSPYNYNWSNGTSTAANNNLIAGTYTVTVSDANSCTATASVTVTQPSALSLTTSSTNVKCNGGNSGSASVSATGGTSPYGYN
ncbi:MAG: hypothetical protein WCM76_13705, partial [Bacteroidota bacterium]